jgi:predicted DCC family thiol-disulfide oxidoreductase YuxK
VELSTNLFIVLFDGECAFCARQVAWIAAHDRENRFRFAPRLSAEGRDVLRLCGIDGAGPESMIFVVHDGSWRALSHSDAVVGVASNLGKPWRYAAIAKYLPRMIRDSLYGLIAKFRKRLGSRACGMPTDAVRSRLLVIQPASVART